jgi:hypothetical protein
MVGVDDATTSFTTYCFRAGMHAGPPGQALLYDQGWFELSEAIDVDLLAYFIYLACTPLDQ